jgi:hypothetical protein
MKIVGNFSLPGAVFPKTAFRALPNRFDRGARQQRYELVNRRRAQLSSLGYTHADGTACTYPSADPYCFGEVPYLDSAPFVNTQNQAIATSINAAPTSAAAVWEQQYGYLPQTTQNAVMDFLLAQDNLAHFGIALPAQYEGKSLQQIITENTPKIISPGNMPNVVLNPKTGTYVPVAYQAPALPSAPAQGGAPPSAPKPSTTPSSTAGGGGTTDLTNPPGTNTGTSKQQTQQQTQTQTQQQNGGGDGSPNWGIIAAVAAGLFLITQMGRG